LTKFGRRRPAHGLDSRHRWPIGSAASGAISDRKKKQGATGITTVAPYVAGQWGRGNNRLPE
jgi:hypothetical protein